MKVGRHQTDFQLLPVVPLSETQAQEELRLLEVRMPDRRLYRLHETKLCEALTRIGGGADARKAVRWLLTFAQTNLAGLTPDDWEKMRYEVEVFAQTGGLPLIRRGATSRTTAVRWGRRRGHQKYRKPWGTAEEEIEHARLPSQEVVDGLQKRALYHLNQLIETGQTWVRQLPGLYMVCIDTARMQSVGFVRTRQSNRDTPERQFLAFVLRLIADCAYRIRRCPESGYRRCAGLFLAKRVDQRYCSPRCQSRATMRTVRREGHQKKRTKVSRPKSRSSRAQLL